jgi:3-carboxy-cis,cis-muconate cycloisomerase
MHLLDDLFRSPAVERIYSDISCVQAMLDFEAALVRAEARAGLIPTSAAPAISSKCGAELIDLASLAHAAASAGNLAIPLIKQLTALVAKENPEAARYVHWGATSQDVIDTGAVLQLRDAFVPVLADLDALADALADLAQAHRRTVLPARTWMQQALPTSFGFIAAGWLDALLRHRQRLLAMKKTALVLQFGGAVGTLASLGQRGTQVAGFLAEELRLALPGIPWHTQRDRIAEVATTFGLVAGTLSKIARDLSLHMQTEIQEIHEPSGEGRGGSSTLPHKRNPVTCAAVLGATLRVPALVGTMLGAMDQPQQRALGSWHAEWETLPEIVRLTAGGLHHLAAVVPRLSIDEKRMRENLHATHGLIFAEAVSMVLSEKLGRQAAHERVESACRRAQSERRHLGEILASERDLASLLPAAELDRLFDPLNYLGSADAFIDHVLAANRSRHQQNQAARG